ncbi:MAG: DUF5654 family protein [Candidatus Roizmanbacteria bacterium]
MSHRYNSRHHESRIQHLTSHTGRPSDTLIILSISVLAFIVALAWRSASEQAFIEMFPKDHDKLKTKTLYAITMTVITIIVIYCISKCR